MTHTPDNTVDFPKRPTVVTADSGDTVYVDVEEWSWEYGADKRDEEIIALAEENAMLKHTLSIYDAGYCLFQDGTDHNGNPMWCATGPSFVNLQESVAVFDTDLIVALTKLIAMRKEPTT